MKCWIALLAIWTFNIVVQTSYQFATVPPTETSMLFYKNNYSMGQNNFFYYKVIKMQGN